LIDGVFGEVIQLASQIVFKLTFFGQEISTISVIKIVLVFSQGVEVVVFNPGEVSITGQTVKFEFDSLASSKQRHLDDSSLKALEVPKSGDPD